jgi:hypothetical protein
MSRAPTFKKHIKMGIDKEGRMKKELQIGKDEGGMSKLK